MNKKVFTGLKLAVAIFFAAFIISQFYSIVVNPVSTDTVYPYSAYSGYETEGFIVRNEVAVDFSEDGILSFEVSNGGRVAKNGTIANLYASENDADIQLQIESLEQRINTLEEIQAYNDLNASDLNSVNSSIHKALFSVIGDTQNGHVTVSGAYDALLESFARRQIITGEAKDFNGLISSLKSQRDALKAQLTEPKNKLKSPLSGYVIYSVDGYENSFEWDEVTENLTVEQIKNVKPNEVSQNAVCKIVSDYEWYIAAVLPFDEALKLKQGSKVTLKTKLQSTPELIATVKYVNKQSVTGDAAVVFACDTMNTELASQRKIEVSVVYEQHTGLKVDRRAIRVVDGQRGVFVLTASQVKFVPVEVLWEGDNYSIVKQEAADKKVLRIYDEIIVKGKNLYDGKVID